VLGEGIGEFPRPITPIAFDVPGGVIKGQPFQFALAEGPPIYLSDCHLSPSSHTIREVLIEVILLGGCKPYSGAPVDQLWVRPSAEFLGKGMSKGWPNPTQESVVEVPVCSTFEIEDENFK